MSTPSFGTPGAVATEGHHGLRAACLGMAIVVVGASSAVAGGLEVVSSTDEVGVGDFGSNAPLGCGEGAAL